MNFDKANEWLKQTGQDRYATEIVAESMQMLGGRSDSGFNESPYPSAPAQQPAASAPTASQVMTMDDDIPF